MIDGARQLVALVETIAPLLDEVQARRAIRTLMAIAGEGEQRAPADEQLRNGRADRELSAPTTDKEIAP